MAKGIRFTAKERDLILQAIGLYKEDAKTAKLIESIKRKLTEEPKAAVGLSVKAALEAFRETLGNRLVVPPNGAVGVFVQMANRLKLLGLSRADCVTIAKTAGAEWRGPVKAQSLINQAEALLQRAQGEFPWGDKEPPGGWQGAAPMEDM